MVVKAMKIICVLFFFVLFDVFAIAQNIPKPVGYINDFAQVLSSQTEETLTKKIQSYRDVTGIEVAVVTVPSLQGYEIEPFTLKLAQSWGVGNKEKDNGVVLLLAPNERGVRIEVGYGLEGDLTDGQSGYILDQNAVPYFKNNDWAGGLNATVSALLVHLGEKTYQTRIEEKEKAERVRQQRQRELNDNLALFFVFAIPTILLIVLVLVIRVWYKHWKNLKKIQKRNDADIKTMDEKFEGLNKKLEEAKKIFVGLKDVNINSVRTAYSETLKEIATSVNNFKSIILPELLLDHGQLQRAQKVSETITLINRDIAKAEEKADKIISLPKLIASKKDWVVKNKTSILYKLGDVIARVTATETKLNEEFGVKIKRLIKESSPNVEVVELAFSDSDKLSKADWIHLSELLNVVETNSNHAIKLVDEYFALVEKAKNGRVAYLAELESAIEVANKAIKHSDVKNSTKNCHRTAISDAIVIEGWTEPKEEKSWVLFLNKITGTISELKKVAEQAKNDINEAEEERQRVKRREENARRTINHITHRTSSSSSRSSSFGGGSFGGGGASRRF